MIGLPPPLPGLNDWRMRDPISLTPPANFRLLLRGKVKLIKPLRLRLSQQILYFPRELRIKQKHQFELGWMEGAGIGEELNTGFSGRFNEWILRWCGLYDPLQGQEREDAILLIEKG